MSTTKVNVPGEAYAQDGLRITDAAGPLVISGADDPNVSPPSSVTKGSLYMRTGAAAQLWQNTDGATAWSQIGSGGSITIPDWTPGTYAAGSIVKHAGYLWQTATGTSLAPLIEHGNLGSATDWQGNGTATWSQSGNVFTLASGATGNANGISNIVDTGWDGRLFEFSVSISGAYQGYLNFGILDGSLPATTPPVTGMLGVTGFWGVHMTTRYNPRLISAVANGSSADTYSYVNRDDGNIAYELNDTDYINWGIQVRDDGTTASMKLYRNGSLLTEFVNFAKPAFAGNNYRPAIGYQANNAVTFRCNSVRSTPLTSGWTSVAKLFSWGPE